MVGKTKYVFAFPGQGAQTPGMMRDMCARFPEARAVLDAYSAVTGIDIPSLLWDSSAEELARTDKSQTAITAASLSAAKILETRGIAPHAVMGFSLGEWSAMYAAGVLSFEETAYAVQKRGEIMQRVCDAIARGSKNETGAETCDASGAAVMHGKNRAASNAAKNASKRSKGNGCAAMRGETCAASPFPENASNVAKNASNPANGAPAALPETKRPAGMSAIIGLSPDAVQNALLGRTDVFAVNLNSVKQTVIAGTAYGLSWAADALKNAGARRVIPLSVAGPFHSPLMQRAADEFSCILSGLSFKNPRIALFGNVTGKQVLSGEEAKENAVKHIVSPVLWTAEEQSLADWCKTQSATCRFIEVGPGKTLCGFWRDTPYAEQISQFSWEDVPCLCIEANQGVGENSSLINGEGNEKQRA